MSLASFIFCMHFIFILYAAKFVKGLKHFMNSWEQRVNSIGFVCFVFWEVSQQLVTDES